MSSKKTKGAKAQIEAIESNGVHFEVAPEFQASADAPTATDASTPKKKSRKPREVQVSRSRADENGIKDGDHVRDGVVFRVEVDDNDPAKAAPPTTEAIAPTKAKSKKTKKPKAELTIALLAEGYLHALEDSGAGNGTIASYGMELKTAVRELGSETLVAQLTEDRVAEFFKSDAVMKTRNGKPKAPPTFLKTQRVFRQALVWAQTEKLIAKAPLPEPKQ